MTICGYLETKQPHLKRRKGLKKIRWQMHSLPTLEIRVEQKWNRVKKETKMGEKKKKNQFCLDRESKPGPVDN